MREVLAIKPDIVFVWDEAWFAFARFTPTYRQRTAMESAHVLEDSSPPRSTGRPTLPGMSRSRSTA